MSHVSLSIDPFMSLFGVIYFLFEVKMELKTFLGTVSNGGDKNTFMNSMLRQNIIYIKKTN